MDALITSGPLDAPLLLLTHGAGADCESTFMTAMCEALSTHGVGTARFNFGYMAARKVGGKRRPPPKAELLIGEMSARISEATILWPGRPLFIGGKSMGGRIASMIAGTAHRNGQIRGCVCVGYPFHPAGKPDKLRTSHLVALACPTLIVQGTRDALGSQEEVSGYSISPAIEVRWLDDGDHDLKPRKASGHTHPQHLERAAAAIAGFVSRHEGR